ncbi:MAG: isoprenyl transferase [Bacteroidetes bacterium]|nr:MAG: isoprenyl transferase [Bacteroidota bacterium]
MSTFPEIDLNNVPKHIAIIMDGNGRWAKKQGKVRLYGHSIGVESVRGTLKAAQKMGVKYLTLYAFSTENWNRPKEEVDGLMNLLAQTIVNEVDELDESGVRIMCVGNNSELPEYCQNELAAAMERTKGNDNIHLVLALNYSARWELKNAMKLFAQEYEEGRCQLEDLDDEKVHSYLATKGIPDPELLIRTSGEYRISNFLLWQIAYTEFHFTDVLWPEFRDTDLYKAVLDYQSRERRFGLVSEQLK